MSGPFDVQKMRDEAWDKDDRATNNRLKDGDMVRLLVSTKGQNNHCCSVLPGATGRIVHARTPRVHGPGVYFANVDIALNDGAKARIRVPHNALQILRRG